MDDLRYVTGLANQHEIQRYEKKMKKDELKKTLCQTAKWALWAGFFLGIIGLALVVRDAGAVEIDHERICQIESNCNARAKRETSTDRSYGLYQISPIVLEEWNNFHPRHQYPIESLFDPYVNYTIYNWYMNKRIPQMLKHFGKPDTVRNRIIAYNAGISYVAHDKPIPSITKRYLRDYGVDQ
jgi:hypothetical protein